MTTATPPEERFWLRVDKSDGPDACWEYQGSLKKGYGQFHVGPGCVRPAHRYAWQLAHGTVAANLVLDHLCRNRACCNIRHLELVTHRLNILRGIGIAAVNAKLTHCRRGHPFAAENLRFIHGGKSRVCKACARLRRIERSARLARTQLSKKHVATVRGATPRIASL